MEAKDVVDAVEQCRFHVRLRRRAKQHPRVVAADQRHAGERKRVEQRPQRVTHCKRIAIRCVSEYLRGATAARPSSPVLPRASVPAGAISGTGPAWSVR
jgi:hypothetical protein